jgi:hypothetical protein
MGGINPNIALATRAPDIQIQVPQPLDQFSKVMTLQNLMQQGQLRQMEAAKAQQDLADRQYKAENLRKFRSLYNDPDKQPTPDDVMRTLGPDGTKVIQEMIANEKEQIANTSARLGRLGGKANAILTAEGGPNNFIYTQQLKQAVADKDLDPETANQMLQHDVNDPQVLQQLRLFRDNAMDAQKQQDFYFKQADNAHKLVTDAAEGELKKQEALRSGLQTYQQGLGMVKDAPSYDAYIAKQPEDVKAYLAGVTWSPQLKDQLGTIGIKPEAGKTVPLPAAVTQQEIETTQGKTLAEQAAKMQALQPVIQSVLRGDTNYQTLDPGIQKEIAPGLIMGGFQGFGKLLSDQERGKLADMDKALTILQATKNKIGQPDNQDMMGPIRLGTLGGTAVNSPWATEHRNLQSDLVTQQQELKKFITNGSLRGLNAETLNQMFPNISTHPDVAAHQMENLINTVTSERQQFVNDLAGKIVPQNLQQPPAAPRAPAAPAAPAPAATPTTAAPPGKVHVRRPDGKTGYINSSAWPAMQKQGYAQIP